MKRTSPFAVILLILSWVPASWASCLTNGYALNQSYTTLCAEVDNINIPLLFTNVTSYRVTATHPAYYPSTIYEGAADFTNCETITETAIWRIGTNNTSNAEFRNDFGFVPGDGYFAQDNPAAGTDEAWTNFPGEINNDWMFEQYIKFTAAESGDANTELTIGAQLTVSMAGVSGTLELNLRVWNGTGWTDLSNQLFTTSNKTRTWSIPDFTWLEGTDANAIHLDVVTAGEGGASTVNAWAQYDYLELRKRDTLGETFYALYDDGTSVVQALHIDFWWRAPQAMKVGVIGGATNNNVHYMRLARLTPTNASWNQFFVLYEDGNARLLPLPPNGILGGHFGASIILGPSADGARPFCAIDTIIVDPRDMSLDITYESGAKAHLEVWSGRERTVVDVDGITYGTVTQNFARLRSMWVHDGKADVDRIESEDGIFPVMNHWSALGGTWWNMYHSVPTYHNTYAPDFEVDILVPSQAFLTRQAESLDAGLNYTITTRTNAIGGSVASMTAAGGEASFNIALDQLRPDVELLIRYTDADGGDNGNNPGNLLDVYVDGVWKDFTTTMNTGGTTNFETAPAILLGDLTPGTHTVLIVTGPLTQGVDLDQIEFISKPKGYWSTNGIASRECEVADATTGSQVTNRSNASAGQSLLMLTAGGTAIYNNVFVAAPYSNAYARVRYADDWAPNKVEFILDATLAGKFPSLNTQPLWLSNQGFEIGPAGGLNATSWWRYGDAGMETWANETGTNGMAFYPWGTNHYGGFGQDVSVTNAEGNVYTFSISGQFEPSFTSTTAETWLKLEFWVTGESTNRYAITNSVYATLKAAPNVWHRLRMSVTNADSAINFLKVIVGFGNAVNAGGSQAAKWDNAVLTQSTGTPFNAFAWSQPLFIGSLATGNHTIALVGSGGTEGLHLDQIELFTIARGNRAPGVGVPSPITLAVGSTTGFAVTVSEYDPDCVSLANTVAPTNSAFVTNTFLWTAPPNAAGTTNLVAFVANDQSGSTNGIVTNVATVIVPYDIDADGMGDGWEWVAFVSLTNLPSGDPDGDTVANVDEFVAGTSPTSGASFFHVTGQGLTAPRPITVPTQPGRHYSIYFADGAFSNGMNWARFANTNIGLGTWTETNAAATTYSFVDDYGPATTGGESASGVRHYSVRVQLP